MSRKQLNVEGITNELEGASLFFTRSSPAPAPPPAENQPEHQVTKPDTAPPPPAADNLPRPTKNVTVKPRASKLASNQASLKASIPAPIPDDLIETIRKTVKPMGKEVSYVRLTPDEKQELLQTIFNLNRLYRGQGHKTTETEVVRIAMNFLLADYREKGEQSVLVKVLNSLNT